MSEKIATKFVDHRTGVVYTIGTRGEEEMVQVSLSAPDTTTVWTDYKVTVQNITQSTSAEYELDEHGVCKFSIPLGEIYEVTLPAVGDYMQPSAMTFTAALPARPITHAYAHEELKYEQVDIHLFFNSIIGDVSWADGKIAIAKDENNVIYVGTFTDGYTVISIPYGVHYTLTMPDIEGHYHDHQADSHQSGLPSREVLVTYHQETFGIMGRDETGKYYSIEEIAELEDKSIIVAGAYNDSFLASSPRLDGATGNGFMWSIASPTTSGQWASDNVEFDQRRLQYTESEPVGLIRCAGKYYTEAIYQIALEKGLTSTMCSNAMAKTLTIAGVDLQGFVLAYRQIKSLINNRSQYEAFYAALGKSAPAIWSGYWWTSCQYSAPGGVRLSGGSFSNNHKDNSYSVLVGFDL